MNFKIPILSIFYVHSDSLVTFFPLEMTNIALTKDFGVKAAGLGT